MRHETHAQTFDQPRTSSLLKDLPQTRHCCTDDLSFSMTSVLNTVGKVDLVCQGDALLVLSNTSKRFATERPVSGCHVTVRPQSNHLIFPSCECKEKSEPAKRNRYKFCCVIAKLSAGEYWKGLKALYPKATN